jgi:hypothetical protein
MAQYGPPSKAQILALKWVEETGASKQEEREKWVSALRDARRAGCTLGEIAAVAGISRTSVYHLTSNDES